MVNYQVSHRKEHFCRHQTHCMSDTEVTCTRAGCLWLWNVSDLLHMYKSTAWSIALAQPQPCHCWSYHVGRSHSDRFFPSTKFKSVKTLWNNLWKIFINYSRCSSVETAFWVIYLHSLTLINLLFSLILCRGISLCLTTWWDWDEPTRCLVGTSVALGL